MRTGIETASFGNYGAWVASPDWAYDQLRRHMVCDPGECHEYSTGNTHLLSVILTRRSGKSLRRYMLDELFRPMGIGLGEWDRDPQGRYLGGNNMSLRPRDMLKFGQLFADGGVWNGQRIVREQWVGASTLAHVELGWLEPEAWDWQVDGYGYQWLTGYFEFDGRRLASYAARGYGQQVLMVIPELELVVAVNSHGYEETAEQANQVFALIARFIIPAVPAG